MAFMWGRHHGNYCSGCSSIITLERYKTFYSDNANDDQTMHIRLNWILEREQRSKVIEEGISRSPVTGAKEGNDAADKRSSG